MVNLYQKEVEDITSTVEAVQSRFWGKEASGENLARLHKELVGRLQDLGFVAEVDVGPVLSGQPAVVLIADRVDQEVWDVEKRQYELKKIQEKNEKTPDIEGNV
jgi:hypothetical protein